MNNLLQFPSRQPATTTIVSTGTIIACRVREDIIYLSVRLDDGSVIEEKYSFLEPSAAASTK